MIDAFIVLLSCTVIIFITIIIINLGQYFSNMASDYIVNTVGCHSILTNKAAQTKIGSLRAQPIW